MEKASSKHFKELGTRGGRAHRARHQEYLQAEEEGESRRALCREAVQVQARVQEEASEDEEEAGGGGGGGDRRPPWSRRNVEVKLELNVLLNARIPRQLLLETSGSVLRGCLRGQVGRDDDGPTPLLALLKEWQARLDLEPTYHLGRGRWCLVLVGAFTVLLLLLLDSPALALLVHFCIFLLHHALLHRELGRGG